MKADASLSMTRLKLRRVDSVSTTVTVVSLTSFGGSELCTASVTTLPSEAAVVLASVSPLRVKLAMILKLTGA